MTTNSRLLNNLLMGLGVLLITRTSEAGALCGEVMSDVILFKAGCDRTLEDENRKNSSTR